jgi:hypothetical protein
LALNIAKLPKPEGSRFPPAWSVDYSSRSPAAALA